MASAQHVRRFDISVDDPLGHQIAVGAADLGHDLESVVLCQLPFLRDELAETAVGAVL